MQPATLALFTASVPIEASKVQYDPNIHDMKPIAQQNEDDIKVDSVDFVNEENHDEETMDNAKLSTNIEKK